MGRAEGLSGVTGSGTCARRPGWRAWVPGLAQWSCGQRERSSAYLGAFLGGAVMAVLAWGTPLGLLMWGVMYGSHVASATDALRQWSFPGFAKGTPVLATAMGLGVVLHVPILVVGSALAWPGAVGSSTSTNPGERFLIDRWAYGRDVPDSGDWVYTRSRFGPDHEVARVVAGPGQSLEITEAGVRVDGRPLPWTVRDTWKDLEIRLQVPAGSVLVLDGSGPGSGALGVRLIATERLAGRAWACYYPITRRRWLD